MALNIKDPNTEQLIAEVAELAHETKIQAVRAALEERKERLQAEARLRRRQRAERLTRFLENEAWPQIPDSLRRHPITKEEREAVLGYGPEGV
jgi:antitoxin VapB